MWYGAYEVSLYHNIYETDVDNQIFFWKLQTSFLFLLKICKQKLTVKIEMYIRKKAELFWLKF